MVNFACSLGLFAGNTADSASHLDSARLDQANPSVKNLEETGAKSSIKIQQQLQLLLVIATRAPWISWLMGQSMTMDGS